MFRFICKSLHRVSSDVRASTPRNPYIIQIHSFSSPFESLQNSPNQHSFALTYLIKSCGLTPERALSASKLLKFEANDKPDSVLAFFKQHGFTQTQITKIVAKHPRILSCNLEETLFPKLEFLKSKGLSSGYVAKIVYGCPALLARSLENTIIPSFNFFSNLFQSEEKTVVAIKQYPGILLLEQTQVIAKIEIMREAGVPIANIMFLLKNQPRPWRNSNEWHRNVLDEVKKMGFSSSKVNFVLAVYVLRAITKVTWEKKVEIYKKWGWSDDNVSEAFKKFPGCMAASEQKINGVMGFFVNQMGCESLFVARMPVIISLSLPKRIVPRSAVYQALLLKGLIKTEGISLMSFVHYPEMQFQKKVLSYPKEAPELLKLYREKLDLAK